MCETRSDTINGIDTRFSDVNKSIQRCAEQYPVTSEIFQMQCALRPATAAHAARVATYIDIWYMLGTISQDQYQYATDAALLHDCGKLDYRYRQLYQVDALRADPFREHTVWGALMLHQGGLPQEVCEVVLYHHENWNGKGLPYGMKGSTLPYLVRVLRILDRFDARLQTSSVRFCQTGHASRLLMTNEKISDAASEIHTGFGIQFDPALQADFATFIQTLQKCHR